MYMNNKLSYLFLFLYGKKSDLEKEELDTLAYSEDSFSIVEEESNALVVLGTENASNDLLLLTPKDYLSTKSNFKKHFTIHYLSNLYRKTYKFSSHLLFKQVIVNCLNTFTNSFVSVLWQNKLIFNKSIGLVDATNLGEKYGYISIAKKVQQFFLFLKWSKRQSLKYVKINCNGLKRFFRSSMGHLTQLSKRWLWRYRRALRRYRGWLFKFAKMIKKYGRAPVQTIRQRKRTRWFKRNVMYARKKVIIWKSLNLKWSLPHNGCKVRKRKGKYAFGYTKF